MVHPPAVKLLPIDPASGTNSGAPAAAGSARPMSPVGGQSYFIDLPVPIASAPHRVQPFPGVKVEAVEDGPADAVGGPAAAPVYMALDGAPTAGPAAGRTQRLPSGGHSHNAPMDPALAMGQWPNKRPASADAIQSRLSPEVQQYMQDGHYQPHQVLFSASEMPHWSGQGGGE